MYDTTYVNSVPDTKKDFGSPYDNSVSNLYVCEIRGDKDYGTVFKATKAGVNQIILRSLRDDSVRIIHVNELGEDGFTAQIWSRDGRLCRAPIPPIAE